MKINQNRISQIMKNYNNNQVKNEKKTDKTRKRDQISLSKEALELQNFKGKLQATSKEREERITRLKRDVKQGDYNVSGEDIAKKMLDQVINKFV
ncbi:FlgM family anti-sigma-28 factor [Orenia metallireducens]|uniref:Negative regulator of flagellin synthesis n=1 Tax=Orenia metallireducens TaxID=1413210 RepID=A0A285GB48_9FIRM|nr:flagellar biosynthesis anti-sigma factor FlgM [Orenia metallireducens]PRX32574.1 FlgM family anti-sigma-28 factor [Orenia metallireducens]SNY20800.1 anti-sigma-28 factor, FlgM family [Orenia metallireducens]